jgi:hypothetical protein
LIDLKNPSRERGWGRGYSRISISGFKISKPDTGGLKLVLESRPKNIF